MNTTIALNTLFHIDSGFAISGTTLVIMCNVPYTTNNKGWKKRYFARWNKELENELNNDPMSFGKRVLKNIIADYERKNDTELNIDDATMEAMLNSNISMYDIWRIPMTDTVINDTLINFIKRSHANAKVMVNGGVSALRMA